MLSHNKMSTITNNNKWFISLWTVFVAIVIFNPIIFEITNYLKLISPNLKTITNNCITKFGWFFHFIVFFIIIRLMMDIKKLPWINKSSKI
jgi:hypothetical protein